MKRTFKQILRSFFAVMALSMGTAQAAVTGTVQYIETYFAGVNNPSSIMYVGVQTTSGLVVLKISGMIAAQTIVDNAYRHGGTLTFDGFLPNVFQVNAGP